MVFWKLAVEVAVH